LSCAGRQARRASASASAHLAHRQLREAFRRRADKQKRAATTCGALNRGKRRTQPCAEVRSHCAGNRRRFRKSAGFRAPPGECAARSRPAPAHIIVAMLTEAYARRHCDIGLFDQQLENSRLPSGRNFSGTGTQANIGVGAGIFQPAWAKLRPSRRAFSCRWRAFP